jgi:hypothetical protein
MIFLNKIRIVLSFCLIAIFILGIIGFLSNFILSSGIKNQSIELPLGKASGIQVNEYGIYIGIKDFSRIQLYDLNGKFKKAWSTNTFGNDFDFLIDENGKPQAFRTFYDREKLTDEEIDNVAANIEDTSTINYLKKHIKSPESKPTYFKNYDQGEFYLRGKLNLKLIHKHNNKERVILSQPFYITCFVGPINSWFTGAFSMLAFTLLNIQNILKLSYDKNVIHKKRNLWMFIKKIIFD